MQTWTAVYLAFCGGAALGALVGGWCASLRHERLRMANLGLEIELAVLRAERDENESRRAITRTPRT